MLKVTAEQIDAVARWANADPLIEAAYVFGSRAKGHARPDSDIDIAVKVSGKTEGEALANAICEKARWVTELELLLGLTVDLQSMMPDDVVVSPAVTEHGVLVFER